MKELVYSKFSNERDRKFSIRTDIYEEEGKRFVKKARTIVLVAISRQLRI